MLRASTRLVLPLVALLALGAGALAQTVTPSNRVLAIDEGRSAKATIEIDGCNAEWSVENSNPEAFTVKGVPNKATSKLNLTIEAVDGAFPASGTISVSGGGGSCGKFSFDVDLMVFATMVQKDAEKQIKSLAKQNLNFMKQQIKAAEKQLKADLKAIEDDLKDGQIDLADYMDVPDPGMTALRPWDVAMIAASLAELVFFTTVYGAYYDCLSSLSFSAHFVLLAYIGPAVYLGYIAPLAYLRGGCGTWDSFLVSAYGLLAGTMLKASLTMKKFNAKLKKGVVKNGEDAAVSEIETIINDPGTGGADPIAGTGVTDEQKTFEINKVKAWNSADDSGNDNGRIRVTGRATAGPVTVTITKEENGMSTEVVSDDFDIDDSTCAYMVFWPPLEQQGNLSPGAYKVRVLDANGNSQLTSVTVPVR